MDNYDSSVNGSRKKSGCNYCQHRKDILPIDDKKDISSIKIYDEEKKMTMIDYENCDHEFKIYFCPLYGRKL